MSDEGNFSVPGTGSPGNGPLQPWRESPPTPVPPRDLVPAGGPPPGPPAPRFGMAMETLWRLVGAGAVVAFYFASGVRWFGVTDFGCSLQPPDLQDDCALASRDAWDALGWGKWTFLIAGGILLVRAARVGPSWLDPIAVGLAGLTGLFALRALFDPPEGFTLRLTGPLVVLPLAAVLVGAALSAYRAARAAGEVVNWRELGERARARLSGRSPAAPGAPDDEQKQRPGAPGMLRPGSIWRHRKAWAIGAGVLVLFVLANGRDEPGVDRVSPPQEGSVVGQNGGAQDPGGGGPTASASPSADPAEVPDGATLVTEARRAVTAARSVHVEVDGTVRADLDLHRAGRVEGTVRRPGSVQRYQVEWDKSSGVCMIDNEVTSPCRVVVGDGLSLDLTTLWPTFTTLPDAAGARTNPQPGEDRPRVPETWEVTAKNGAVLRVPVEGQPLPTRFSGSVDPFGSLVVKYSDWNE